MEKTTRSGAAHRMASGVLTDLAEFAHSLARSLFDPYRPELYYMRGPGPKWHAKHDRAPVAYQAIRGGHSDRERGRPGARGTTLDDVRVCGHSASDFAEANRSSSIAKPARVMLQASCAPCAP